MSFALKAFEKQCLNAHNSSRALYNAPPLILSNRLSKHATEWAESLAKRNAVYYRPNNIYGENIYYLKNENRLVTGDEPVQRWFGAITKIYEGKTRNEEPTNNLLQLIWNQTKELGIGIAQKDGKIWIVTNYYPKCIVTDFQQERAPQFPKAMILRRRNARQNRLSVNNEENAAANQNRQIACANKAVNNENEATSAVCQKVPKKSVSFSV